MPLNQQIIMGFDFITGKMVSEMDINGNVTSYEYDGFGNLVKTTLPTGKIINTSYSWVTNNNPENSCYSITTSSTGSSTNITYYDFLGRELRNVNTGFEGEQIIVDKQYYPNGNLKNESLPYKTGNPVWTTYEYDKNNRIDLVISPTCSLEYTYSGKTITVTDCKGESKSKTMNSIGDISSASDFGGNIQYYYHSSGQIRKIKFP
ncbi:MAG: RHS repeat protein [Bacteroidales bacterium]|nr:RHS repeat protein [Bacteroidales bacterium]